MRVTLTLLITAIACAIASPARSADPSPKEEVNPFKDFAPFLWAYNQKLLSPTRQLCTNPPIKFGFPTCEIEVDVWLVYSGGTDYCLTQFPKEVTFDRLTRVVWKLKRHTLHSSDTGNTYYIGFHDKYGILPHIDNYGQVHAGGFGDGDTPNKWWYHRFNLYLHKDPAIVYLPLILHVLSTDSNNVGVCAVGDPRMVNE